MRLSVSVSTKSKRATLILSKYQEDEMPKRSGFTIIELVVVLTLIGVLAAMIIPRWATSPALDSQLQLLLSDIRYTQALALSHGQRFRINFILPSTYSITTIGGTIVNNPSTGSAAVTLTSGVTITGLANLPNNLIAFDEQGIPYTNSAATTALAADATITLSANGVTRSIVITPTTGLATAQ